MKKATIGAAAAAILLGLAALPASAGKLPAELVVTPEVVEQGGSTVISNADDSNSTCQPLPVQVPGELGPTFESNALVEIEIEDPNGDTIVDDNLIPGDDGNWSYETDSLETVGEYSVFVSCGLQDDEVTATPADTPSFDYAVATFEVIAQAPTTIAPTTTTTAATAAVTATPSYTG